jgi:hypothetical protein
VVGDVGFALLPRVHDVAAVDAVEDMRCGVGKLCCGIEVAVVGPTGPPHLGVQPRRI